MHLLISSLLHALETRESSSSELAAATGFSRITVRRCLSELLPSGFIKTSGKPPRFRYGVYGLADLLACEYQAMGDAEIAVFQTSQARLLSEALDLLSRLHLGQWDAFTSHTRFYVEAPYLEQLEHSKTLLDLAKTYAWGLPPSASLSIYNKKVAESGFLAWAAHRALRHRLSWDQTPEGGFGVTFDEPLSLDANEVSCWSYPGQVVLAFLPKYKSVLLKALEVYQEASKGSTRVLMSFLHPTLSVPSEDLDRCKRLLVEAEALLSPLLSRVPSKTADLQDLSLSLSQATQGEQAAATANEHLRHVAESAPEIPKGFLLGKKGPQTRILELVPDKLPVIRGYSYSAQTALCMARNMAQPRTKGVTTLGDPAF
jgi:hypothetical protein